MKRELDTKRDDQSSTAPKKSLRQFYEEYAARVDNRISMHDSPIPIRRYLNSKAESWVLTELQEHWDTQSSLLDIGCGGGFFASILANQVKRYFGCDISSVEASRARDAGIHISVGNAERLPFISGTMDTVLLYAVVEHLPNPYMALQECARVLKVGGVLFLATPNKHSPMELLSQFLHGNQAIKRLINRINHMLPVSVNDPGHISLLSIAQLKTLLVDAGFQVLKVDRIGLYVPGLELIRWSGYLATWEHLEKALLPVIGNIYWALMAVAKRPRPGATE